MQKSILRDRLSRESLSSFFEGKYYPIAVCALTLLGSVTGIEYFLNIIVTGMAITALCVCDTVKPMLVTLVSYVYQISVKHAPGYPTNSDYYISSWRLPVSIFIIAAVFFALLFFTVKNKIYKRISFKKTPLLIPLLAFSAALMLGGAFSSSWRGATLVFALANTVVFLALFLLIYHGFRKDETADSLIAYFAYISMLIALVIDLEVIFLYLTSDSIFLDGSINKVGVALGWGIWNLIGVSSAVLVPACFIGMEKGKRPWLYFSVATLTYIVSVLSMSRNALVFSSLAYAACVLVFCFRGKHTKIMRTVAIVEALLALALAVALWDKIVLLIADNINIGASGDASNGRFALWAAAFDAFKSAPVFGGGFYALADYETAVFGLTPKMAHNTILQLLSATGILGTGAYIYYRVSSLKPFIKRPTLEKTLLGISILVLIFESLLDNFIFNIYPMFYAQIALALAYRFYDEQTAEGAACEVSEC